MNEERLKLRRWITLGVYLALTLVLGLLENQLPPPPLPFPLRYGLSNIMIMYVLLHWGGRWALGLNLGKACFALLTRGPVAGALSLLGGLGALGMAALTLKLTKGRASYILLSVPAAIAHNLIQLLWVALFLPQVALDALFLPLVFLGVLTGSLTGFVLYLVDPVLSRLEAHELQGRQK